MYNDRRKESHNLRCILRRPDKFKQTLSGFSRIAQRNKLLRTFSRTFTKIPPPQQFIIQKMYQEEPLFLDTMWTTSGWQLLAIIGVYNAALAFVLWVFWYCCCCCGRCRARSDATLTKTHALVLDVLDEVARARDAINLLSQTHFVLPYTPNTHGHPVAAHTLAQQTARTLKRD